MTEPAHKHRGRKQLRASVNSERCKGCGLCLIVCPKMALVMDTALNSRGLHFVAFSKDKTCTGCLRCTIMCPDAAIEILEERE